jgi:hypothetical protein
MGKEKKKPAEVGDKLTPSLLFDTEDGDHMFLRKVRSSPHYTSYNPKDPLFIATKL